MRMSSSSLHGRMLALLCAGLSIAIAGCASPRPAPPAASIPAPEPRRPVEDPDGAPARANAIEPGASRADHLDRAAYDLDDWYRIDLDRSGTLHLTITSSPDAEEGLAHFFVGLFDANGERELLRERAGGRDRVTITRKVGRGSLLVWMGSEPEAQAPIPYGLELRFEPRPEPKPPVVIRPLPPSPPPQVRFERVTARVIEIRARDSASPELVLDVGETRGVRVGSHGRLLAAGEMLGNFEVTEVFASGSRAKLDRRLTADLKGASAEIQVPLSAGSEP